MQQLMLLAGVLVLLASLAAGQSADKYTDETRPYKFGFNIEGHQHRKEEKDENGIIKGEYGFITADGYYRVTVYETDVDGDFKIVSMKNYYVGFPPEDPQTTPEPQRNIKNVAKVQAYPATAPERNNADTRSTPKLPPKVSSQLNLAGRSLLTTTTTTTPPTTISRGGACSSCFLPPPAPKAVKPSVLPSTERRLTDIGSQLPKPAPKAVKPSVLPSTERRLTDIGSQPPNTSGRVPIGGSGFDSDRPGNGIVPLRQSNQQSEKEKQSNGRLGAPKSSFSAQQNAERLGAPRNSLFPQQSNGQLGTPGNSVSPQQSTKQLAAPRNSLSNVNKFPIQAESPFSRTPQKETLPFKSLDKLAQKVGSTLSGPQQTTNKNQNVKNSQRTSTSTYPNGNGNLLGNPGPTLNNNNSMKDSFGAINLSRGQQQNVLGDVKGRTDNEINSKISNEGGGDLLYRFNYTLGFHGHHEDGYRNGDKAGDYFVNSRDGDSRRVEYIANEFGYQPNITLVKLETNDRRVPKEDTEKNYGLEGFEFKWFYRK